MRRSSCRVRVGRGALERLVEELAAEPPGRPLIVAADATVAPLWARPLAQRLAARGLAVHELTFPAGERYKTRETKQRLEDRLLALEAGRDAALVAVGGGVTGDLVGFVAATWHRGIPVVQVPTTLLAMVDASVGGKTAVDLPGAKNLVGSFHQPWGIYADPEVLGTLDAARYVEGFAEVVKIAAVADAKLFAALEADAAGLIAGREAGDPARVARVVARCIQLKGRIVAEDAREAGRRAALNFGHTVAHALESASDFALSHGRSVAIGMAVEARLARDATGFPAGHVQRLDGLLDALGLPRQVPRALDPAAVVAATRRDKKNRAGRVRYALPHRLGAMPVRHGFTREVPPNALRAVLDSLQSAD